ncbi:hypothetical protein DFP72DRAFT_856056 [Ephemerocybe angulata]|uniref:PIK-related kinase FAT domain-containing protein n=1 Tax=Ephemerocybe angulata TaxID=980116 RepID=A0A8H6HEV1_9AGAR|nr:hypothetical protein DFP72DRAFT_856056 [Tulosesus angulatus]
MQSLFEYLKYHGLEVGYLKAPLQSVYTKISNSIEMSLGPGPDVPSPSRPPESVAKPHLSPLLSQPDDGLVPSELLPAVTSSTHMSRLTSPAAVFNHDNHKENSDSQDHVSVEPGQFIPRRSTRTRTQKESPKPSTVQAATPSRKKTCSKRAIYGKGKKADNRGSKSKIATHRALRREKSTRRGLGPEDLCAPPDVGMEDEVDSEGDDLDGDMEQECGDAVARDGDYYLERGGALTPEHQPLEATGRKLLGALSAVALSAMDCEAHSRPITDVHTLLRDICADASPSHPAGLNGNSGIPTHFLTVLLKIEGAQRLQGMAELMYYLGVMEFALCVNGSSRMSNPLDFAIREVAKRSVSARSVLSDIIKAGASKTRSMSSLRRYLNDGTNVSALATAACCRVKNELKNMASDSVLRLARMIACPPLTETLVGRTIRNYLIPAILYLQVRYPIKLSGLLSTSCLLDLGFTWTATCSDMAVWDSVMGSAKTMTLYHDFYKPRDWVAWAKPSASRQEQARWRTDGLEEDPEVIADIWTAFAFHGGLAPKLPGGGPEPIRVISTAFDPLLPANVQVTYSSDGVDRYEKTLQQRELAMDPSAPSSIDEFETQLAANLKDGTHGGGDGKYYVRLDTEQLQGKNLRINDKNGDWLLVAWTDMPESIRRPVLDQMQLLFPDLIKDTDTKAEGTRSILGLVDLIWYTTELQANKATPMDADVSTIRKHGKNKVNSCCNVPRGSREYKDYPDERDAIYEAFEPLFHWISEKAQATLPDDCQITGGYVDLLPGQQTVACYPFPCLVVNFNVATRLHRDVGDDNFCITVGFTEGLGGDLCLMETGIVCKSRPGDVFAFRSSRMSHFNLDYVGKRISMVFHTDKAAAYWVEGRNGAFTLVPSTWTLATVFVDLAEVTPPPYQYRFQKQVVEDRDDVDRLLSPRALPRPQTPASFRTIVTKYKIVIAYGHGLLPPHTPIASLVFLHLSDALECLQLLPLRRITRKALNLILSSINLLRRQRRAQSGLRATRITRSAPPHPFLALPPSFTKVRALQDIPTSEIVLTALWYLQQCHPNTARWKIHAWSPPMTLPLHLVKYLAKNFGCWHMALEILGSALDTMKDDDPTIRDYIYDSLAEIYADSELAEEDMFYGYGDGVPFCRTPTLGLLLNRLGCGSKRRRSTNLRKPRSGKPCRLTRSSSAYGGPLGAGCRKQAEKLQQWDILYEFAKSEGNQELMLENAWRTRDWSVEKDDLEEQINRLPEVATPRRRVFEAFIAFLKVPAAVEKNVDFTRCLEDAMQLSLHKWIGLPQHFSVAHIPLLQHFQQFVELQEAVQIFGSLSQTNVQNLEKKSSELKMVLQAWRERLPNIYDDINIWSDLVAWHQNVFNAINLAYMPLICGTSQASGNNSANTSTYGYRGYHETAWIINRFAHVARKLGLLDVCYLPHEDLHPSEHRDFRSLPQAARAGEVATQKAEFHTLKAMFFAKLGKNDDANYAHAQAAQLDMSQAKCWAEWGKYHDRMFKAGDLQNADYSIAASAVSCYMQAVGLYKCAKSRPLLARILWLLSIDDQHNQVAKAFDGYTGDGAYWYWISLAIFYQLRTNREELHALKRHFTLRAQQHAQQQAAMAEAARRAANADGNGDVAMADGTAEVAALPPIPEMPAAPRIAHEHVEEIMQVLKTAFPLLILSLETMVDQIQHKFKQSPEEDVYRNISLLMQDAIQSFVIRMNAQEDDGAMNQQTILTLQRMSGNMPIFIRKDFEDDFVNAKITHAQYMQRLKNWRDRFEKIIDGRPAMQPLALLSRYLTELGQYSKVGEIEVPGQYTEDKDSNQSFVRIQKYAPKFETYRSNGSCWKRFTLYGNDYSKTSFLVQLPCHRQSRREERVIQISAHSTGLSTAKKRAGGEINLNFHLPPIIACSPNVRLFQTDSSYVSLGDIYDLHCDERGIFKEEPILYSEEKVKQVLKTFRGIPSPALTKTEYISVKKDIFDEISDKMVQENILTNILHDSHHGRPHRAVEDAQAVHAAARCRQLRNLVSRSTGLVAMTELLPGMHAGISSQLPVFASTDVVPFRFTPNMQHFVSSTFMEGIIAPSIMAIGQSLTDPEPRRSRCVAQHARHPAFNPVFRQSVQANIDNVVKKAEALACKSQRENLGAHASSNLCQFINLSMQAMQPNVTPITPVLQTVVNQITTATNPLQLAKMGELYNPWFQIHPVVLSCTFLLAFVSFTS